jgi:hypothetical protein
MQMQGNMYYAFVNMQNFQGWSELFGLIEEEVIYQKRVLAAVSGAILPLVALGFIKSLVDYIKPEANESKEESVPEAEPKIVEEVPLSPEDPKKELDLIVVEDPQEVESEQENSSSPEVIQSEEIAEDLSSSLQEEEVEAILSDLSPEMSNTISGYYGDIVIDGNGVSTQETDIVPVNSNKPKSMVDASSKVSISPTRL